MDGLRSELLPQIQSVDVARPEASFSFELANVSKFIQADGNQHRSDLFWCRGLQWRLSVWSVRRRRSKSLSFFLHCESDDPQISFCTVDFELILFSKSPSKPNYVRKDSHTFFQKAGQGFMKFVSYRELTDEKKGFIQDDKITLGVEMKAGPVVRG